MKHQCPSLDVLAHFLDAYFGVHDYLDDVSGVFRAGGREVARLGLALEPTAEMYAWAEASDLDGLFLHRPWKLDASQLRVGVGVLAYHLAFDERLTLSYNPRLASVLLLRDVQALGYKGGRRIGMMGTVQETSFAVVTNLVEMVFGGLERVLPDDGPVTCIAIVGAMTAELLLEARERGASVYVTGQWRAHAERAAMGTGLGVIAVGHRRSEVWGLKALANLLRERFAGLETLVLP